MEKLRFKRNHLLNVVDRLHVERAISNNLEGNPNENLIGKFVNPNILNNPKDDLLTVNPGFGSKISRRVYMLRRSRNTEGGSMVCELCGHASFKLFSTTMEIVEDGKRANQSRRTQTEVVKVCRNCYNEHKAKEQEGSQKTGHKKTIRPLFERSFCGITTGRASKSWHFIRRDIVKTKSQALVNRQCYETEFSDKYLSHESDSDDVSDSDTSYEDSDSEDKSDPLSLRLTNKGWVSPNSIERVQKSDELDRKPSPIIETKGVTVDMLLDSELTIAKSNSTHVSPTSDVKGDLLESTDVIKTLENFIDTPLDLVTETTSATTSQEQPFTGSLFDYGLYDYFSDQPARFRRIKQTQSKKHDLSHKKRKIPRQSKPSVYSGLCDLVTVVNRRKGGHAINPLTSTLYDNEGLEWNRKDLPQYLNLNINKYVDAKIGFRQRKKEIDSFLVEPKLKQVVKYKAPLEPEESVNENQLTNLMDVSVNVVNVAASEDKSDLPGKKVVEVKVKKPLKDTSTLVELTSTKKKEKETVSKVTSEPSKVQVKGPKPKFKHICLECEQDLSRKSYHSYSKETAPLILLKYFKPGMTKLRICKACLVKKQKDKLKWDDSTRKRGKPSDSENSPIPVKMAKVSTTTTTKQTKAKTPPKKEAQPTNKTQATREKKNEAKESTASSINVTVLKNPDATQLKSITTNENTKYVIVKAGTSGGTVQKLSTTMDNDQTLSDITINGKNFKIDSEFKLNELLKDNEKALLSNDSHKDILGQLPSILKRTIGQRNGSPTTYKIVNVLHNTTPNKGAVVSAITGQCTKILPKPSPNTGSNQSGPVTSSLSLQVQEQIRTSMNTSTSLTINNISRGLQKVKTTNSTSVLPTDGPVKPIQLVQPPRATLPNFAAKKRTVFSSPLNTPLPSKNGVANTSDRRLLSNSSGEVDAIVNNS